VLSGDYIDIGMVARRGRHREEMKERQYLGWIALGGGFRLSTRKEETGITGRDIKILQTIVHGPGGLKTKRVNAITVTGQRERVFLSRQTRGLNLKERGKKRVSPLTNFKRGGKY